MTGSGSMELAHARIWARHGRRPPEALWRRIEATRDLGTVLDLARGSALADWLEGVGADVGIHAIEAALRRHWRQRVAEVVSWMPAAWGQAVAWCAVLADLPALQHLARGGAAPPWLADDPELQPLASSPAAARPQVALLLAAARAEPQQLLATWCDEWRRRLPQAPGRHGVEAELLNMLSAHARAFASPQAVDGWALRRALQEQLVLLLRRTLLQPVTAFIYLALSALEFERLRGELLCRAAFPQRWVAP